uniref:Uncharacterized protein n=1 Tax=Oryza rufipogon TaxID=4529 RepID=A0A0E0P2B3_ORYRU
MRKITQRKKRKKEPQPQLNTPARWCGGAWLRAAAAWQRRGVLNGARRCCGAAARRSGERRLRGLHPRPPGATSIPQLTGATSDRLALDPSSTRSGDADPATGRRLLRPPAASPTDECRTADSPVGCFRVQKAKRAASRSSNRDEVIRKEEEQGRLQAELKKVIDELLACHGCFMCDEMFVKTFLCDEMLCVMNAMATTQKHFFFVFFYRNLHQ